MQSFINKTKILPMKYPIVTSYPCHANVLSVVSNSDEYLPWFFNNYIQLNYPKEVHKDGARLDFYVSYLWEACPYIYHQRVSKDFISYKWNTIIEFLIDSIELGFYIHLIVDTFYIPNYKSINKNHIPHDIFIFGYDSSEKVFNVADNFNLGKYSYETANFKDIEEGYKSVRQIGLFDWLDGIEMIRLKENNGAYGFSHKYKFDVDLVKNSIKDYLSSTNNSIKWHYIPSIQWKYDKDYFGIEIYSKLIEYLDNQVEEIGIDMRPFYVLWEHKMVMLLRIQYMINNGFLNNVESISKDYITIERQAHILNSLWIKYAVSEDKKIIQRMVIIIKQLALEETLVLETILVEINL